MYRKLKYPFDLICVILSVALSYAQSFKRRNPHINKKTNSNWSSLKYQVSNNLVLLDGANYSSTILSDVYETRIPILSASVSTPAGENNPLDYKKLNEGLIFRHTVDRFENKCESAAKEYLITNLSFKYYLENIVFAVLIQHLLQVNWSKGQFSTDLKLFNNPSP
jgi:hypothetical protein